jgi:hypothetical protein
MKSLNNLKKSLRKIVSRGMSISGGNAKFLRLIDSEGFRFYIDAELPAFGMRQSSAQLLSSSPRPNTQPSTGLSIAKLATPAEQMCFSIRWLDEAMTENVQALDYARPIQKTRRTVVVEDRGIVRGLLISDELQVGRHHFEWKSYMSRATWNAGGLGIPVL